MNKLKWRSMRTAPRDGTEILCTDGREIRVCYPKSFPRSVAALKEAGRDVNSLKSEPGDVWEYFRDPENAPGQSWSMVPTGWMPLPRP